MRTDSLIVFTALELIWMDQTLLKRYGLIWVTDGRAEIASSAARCILFHQLVKNVFHDCRWRISVMHLCKNKKWLKRNLYNKTFYAKQIANRFAL